MEALARGIQLLEQDHSAQPRAAHVASTVTQLEAGRAEEKASATKEVRQTQKVVRFEEPAQGQAMRNDDQGEGQGAGSPPPPP